MKFSPSCECCGGCAYVASDGNLFSDDFSSLDGSWVGSNATLAATGRFQITSTGALPTPYAYRLASVTSTNLLVVMESLFYPSASAGRSGCAMFFAVTGLGDPGIFQIQTQPTSWTVRAFSTNYTLLGATPADGDKASFILEEDGAGNVHSCFFVNEELLMEATAAWSFAISEKFGLRSGWDGSPITTEYDNFSIHLGNP